MARPGVRPVRAEKQFISSSNRAMAEAIGGIAEGPDLLKLELSSVTKEEVARWIESDQVVRIPETVSH